MSHSIDYSSEKDIIFKKFNIIKSTNDKIVDLQIAFKKIYLDKYL